MFNKIEPPSDLLNVREAASMLRLQVSTIRAWVLQRRIPFVKLGGKRVFFRRADLEELVTASVVPAKQAYAMPSLVLSSRGCADSSGGARGSEAAPMRRRRFSELKVARPAGKDDSAAQPQKDRNHD